MSYSINGATMGQALLSKDINSTPRIEATNDDKKLREQTDAFESVIIKMMMDNAIRILLAMSHQ